MTGTIESTSRITGPYRFVVSAIFLASFIFGSLGPCFSQDLSEARTETGTETVSGNAASTPIPTTYSAPAIPPVKKKAAAVLSRLAITGLGSLPFTLFYTNFIFDAVRFAGNGFDVQYAPWPFKTQYSAQVSSGETIMRLGVSLGISAAIGILDAVIPRKP
jgi:hypothetical protein